MLILEAVIIVVTIVMTGVYIGNTILVFGDILEYKTKKELRKALLIPFYKGWIEIIESVRRMPDK